MPPEPVIEFFDRASMPPEIAELLAEWPDIDPGTARLIRAAVMSREPRRLRQAWQVLAARAELARGVESNWRRHLDAEPLEARRTRSGAKVVSRSRIGAEAIRRRRARR
jgi:hypothetical protein